MMLAMTNNVSRYSRLLILLATAILSSCFLLPREEEVLAPPLAEPPRSTGRDDSDNAAGKQT